MRTPFYGALLIVAAMMTGLSVSVWSHPALGVKVPVLVLALVVWVIGFGMTLRDLSPPAKPRQRRVRR